MGSAIVRDCTRLYAMLRDAMRCHATSPDIATLHLQPRARRFSFRTFFRFRGGRVGGGALGGASTCSFDASALTTHLPHWSPIPSEWRALTNRSLPPDRTIQTAVPLEARQGPLRLLRSPSRQNSLAFRLSSICRHALSAPNAGRVVPSTLSNSSSLKYCSRLRGSTPSGRLPTAPQSRIDRATVSSRQRSRQSRAEVPRSVRGGTGLAQCRVAVHTARGLLHHWPNVRASAASNRSSSQSHLSAAERSRPWGSRV
jgi:hypothetical protein